MIGNTKVPGSSTFATLIHPAPCDRCQEGSHGMATQQCGGQPRYDRGGDPNNPRHWIADYSDLPKVEDLLVTTHPESGARWLNGTGFFNWKERVPADRDIIDVGSRELWYACTGYLIRSDEAERFLEWAETVDFWGRWMPEPAEFHGVFLGEHVCVTAFRYAQQSNDGDQGWIQPNGNCPVKVRTTALEYSRSADDFDCSIEEGYGLPTSR